MSESLSDCVGLLLPCGKKKTGRTSTREAFRQGFTALEEFGNSAIKKIQ